MEVSKYKKSVFSFLAVALVFVFVPVSHANAAGANWELRGILKGKTWQLRSAVLRKKIHRARPMIILELSDIVPLENEFCKENLDDPNKIVIEIPIQVQGGLVNVMPDYENAMIYLGLENLASYYNIKFKLKELNESGLAYAGGDLQISSAKTDTELVGSFRARVCN